MEFQQGTAEVFIPDGLAPQQAFSRTTHLAVGAHPDDNEIMSAAPILDCFRSKDKWFTGVVLSEGRSSPRTDTFKDYSDESMRKVRIEEQKKAASIGEYSAIIMLDYPSEIIKDQTVNQPTEDLALLLKLTSPQFVYTHNLVDKHHTHVCTALRVIEAIRSLPEGDKPKKLYGCEIWRDLDWMLDVDKVTFDLSIHEDLQAALLGVFESQISAGKRYDLASLGRRRANATFFDPYQADASTGLAYAMDLTPLILSSESDVSGYIREHIHRFEQEVLNNLLLFS